MSTCAGIRADGGRCGGQAIRDSQWCFSHHPDYAEERRRRGSKGGKRGGRGRPSPATAELARLQGRFEDLADQVLSGAVDRSDAAVVSQLLNGARACVRDSLSAREQEVLEPRLEELEQLLAARKDRPWGA
jgi:hypothetical protein